MSINDLTTLDLCKAYINNNNTQTTTSDDALLSSMITAMSSSILSFIGRPSMLMLSRTDTFTGVGGQWLGQVYIPHYQPVLSVQSVTINGRSIPNNPNPPNGQGWLLDPWDGTQIPGPLQAVRLNGYSYTANWAPSNCVINYTSGYVTTESGLTIAINDANVYTVGLSYPMGILAQNASVSYSNGSLLTAVASNPGLAQYVPPNPLSNNNPTTAYQFNADDNGNVVNVSYSFIPASIEFAVRSWVMDQYSYRLRVGEKSQSQGGIQTASYMIIGMPDFVRFVAHQFKNENFLGP